MNGSESTGRVSTDGRPFATTAEEDFAGALARFACHLHIEDLPEVAIAAAKMNIFDTLACMAAGSTAKGIGDLRGLANEWGGAPQATILAFGDKVPAHHAAWVNGAMAHARDYDDTHDAAVLHAGVTVIPAAFAAAEWRFGLNGADFIAAVAAGLETICRLGIATKIGIIESGYLYTSLFGHFAATVAAGRVLGLDESEMVNALGIVYSQVAGNHQVTRDGALTKRMQPGFAAKAALVSVQMAQRDIRGAQATFEGVDGFLRVYLREQCDRVALRQGLGTDFVFTQLSYKPYPCCRFNHTAIDAALGMRTQQKFRATRIRRIRVGVNKQAFEAVCTPEDVRKVPRSIVHAQFSMPFTVAAALVDGSVELRHFTDDAIRREDIRALAQRIEIYVDDDIEREWGRNISPSDMAIEMDDGTVHRLRINVPLGNPERPMGTRDFDAKAIDCFRASAIPLRKNAPAKLRNLINELETLKDVRVLGQLLEPPPPAM